MSDSEQVYTDIALDGGNPASEGEEEPQGYDASGISGNITSDPVADSKRNQNVSFRASVSEPERKGEGMTQYISYKLTTVRVVSDSGNEEETVTERRFSDFVWLFDKLAKQYKGYLIPPLPDKAIMGRFSGDFIDERMRGLQIFLEMLAAHSVLSQSTDVESFLFGSDDAFLTLKSLKIEATETTSKSSGISSWFKESITQISNNYGSGKERPKTQDDVACDAVVEYCTELEKNLTVAHANAEALVKKTREESKVWFELGLAFTLLGSYEKKQEELAVGGAASALGSTADRLSVMVTKKAERDNVDFRSGLKANLRLVGAVQAMMKTRAAQLLTYQTAQDTLEARQTDLSKVKGVPGKESKQEALQRQVADAQTDADREGETLTQITETSLAEALKFRNEKSTAIKKLLVEFVQHQIEHSKKVQASWEAMLAGEDN